MKGNILLVDDNIGMIQVMDRILAGFGQTRFATNGADALRLMNVQAPDLVLLDAEMPGIDGFEVCSEIKRDPDLRDIPVIFVTSHTDPEFELAGFNVGAADFIAKPISEPLLRARVKTHLRVKSLADELRRISRVDELTKLVNRSHLDEMLDREWRRSLRSGHPLSLMLVEVDHADLFNERYGRRAGDECLCAVAQALRSIGTRPADLVARFDNHAFALLLPLTPRIGAQAAARRTLDAVEALNIAHATSPLCGHVTVSVGIGCYDESSADWMGATGTSGFLPDRPMMCTAQDLQLSAEKALVRARAAGRAQAWWLDVSDTLSVELAQEITP